ncbi:uncharacterized protein MELLADRAFT_70263 [Melampsora larici-populina 98AG31]|uniref:Uncharacterized protein n=1 Tax=Melampsora larici-populina (strain 98AG31 / pathotype 3-4-7) TaxID=747676 RepID=F4SE98_MELLP|nr:uncharacterized protein MELLADRAFT_70263 [Melampsora larici-populina 98AG31]EGF97026.1 hypothetical protein MELLADRAFT_70263 [Melampsora larici-populina 98AG31]
MIPPNQLQITNDSQTPTNAPTPSGAQIPIDLQTMLMKSFETQQAQIATQNTMLEEMRKEAANREKAYEDLLNKFQDIGVKNTASPTSETTKKKKAPRASTGSIPNKPPKSSKPTPIRKPSQSSTPQRQSTPSTSRVKATGPPKPSPKRHGAQLNEGEWPEGFDGTKNCFYVFIRIIWGLTSSSAVPKPPDPAHLAEFNSRFSQSSEIAGVLDSTSAKDLVDQNEVQVPAADRVNVGGSIVNIKDFFVIYTKAMFAKLGIRQWCPDLESAEDTLWNEACRISALRIFRQWVAADAFAYMNINKAFINDILLLERTYNHYVHFLYGRKYRRELKEEGKNQKDDERKNTLARRRRVSLILIFELMFDTDLYVFAFHFQLMKARAKHANQHNFPSRYQKILKEAEAHSDDEWSAKLQAYVVKTPVYRSAKAGIFIRRLDDHMKISSEIGPVSKVKPRKRVRPRPPRESTFTKPPRGLPIDFYDADWFNNTLSVSQRLNIADCNNVALLPNPEMSLLAKTHPDERLNGRKFTEKHWSEGTKHYNLDHFKEPEDDDEGSESGNSTAKGGSVDLEDFEDEDEDEEGEIEDGEEFEDQGQGKGKAPAKGQGPLFVDDEEMEDDREEEARDARYEAWKNV